MKDSIKNAILTCTLGYFLILFSSLIITIAIKIATGYYPSFKFFTLALITFRLVEIHNGFLIAPLLVAVPAMMILSKTSISNRIVAGLSLATYYLLTLMIYVIKGAGDFPMGIAILWILWVFILGFGTSILLYKRDQLPDFLF